MQQLSLPFCGDLFFRGRLRFQLGRILPARVLARSSAGIDEIILSLSYQPRKIEDLLKDGSDYGVTIKYAVEGTPLGTGGAFKNAEPKYFADPSAPDALNGFVQPEEAMEVIRLIEVCYESNKLKKAIKF